MSEAPFEAQPVVLVDLEKQGDDVKAGGLCRF
jgi:hypothetical protein